MVRPTINQQWKTNDGSQTDCLIMIDFKYEQGQITDYTSVDQSG